jgi:hypothetical protein
MAVQFKSGATEVDLQNPDLGNELERERVQALGRTASGSPVVYDRGVAISRLKLTWNELRESEKVALDSFFTTTVTAMQTSFTYTDQRGTAWTVRFAQPTLAWREVADQVNTTTTYVSGAVTYPTTTRQKGVWAVEVLLEVV